MRLNIITVGRSLSQLRWNHFSGCQVKKANKLKLNNLLKESRTELKSYEPCGKCRHLEVRLQNLLEASRSFVTFPSLPFLEVVTANWLSYG
jgi:hypothetical protein